MTTGAVMALVVSGTASLRQVHLQLCLLTALFDALTGLYAWRRRDRLPAARGFVVVEIGAAGWALSDAVQLLVTTPDTSPAVTRALLDVTSLCQACSVIGYVLMIRWVADPLGFAPRRALRVAAAYTAVAVAVALVDGPAHVFVRAVSLDAAGGRLWTPGPAFFALLAFADGWVTVTLVIIEPARRRAPLMLRRQLTVIMLAGGASAAAYTLDVLARSAGSPVPLAPTALLGAAIVYAWALFRMGLLRAVPIARNLVVDSLDDAVLVVDALDQVVDVNRAGLTLLAGLSPGTGSPLGRSGADLLPRLGLPLPLLAGRHDVALEGRPATLDVRVAAMADRRGRPLATVFTLRDVTAQQQQLATIERLRDELAEQAVRDELTGLYNRRRLAAALDAEVRLAHRTGHDLAVVLLDVDLFKTVNDEHGHDVGDALLRAVADALRQGVHAWDLVARYGGEEFVVLLTDCPPDRALSRAHELRLRCAAVQVPTAQGLVGRTVSAGVALTLLWPAADGAALLKAADTALYRAKRAGRDRVELSLPHEHPAPLS